MDQHVLEVRTGMEIDPSTGKVQKGSSGMAASELFALAEEGACLHLVDKAYALRVASYAPDFDKRYLHTYDYAPEQAWVTYTGDFRENAWIQEDYVFGNRCYFRIALRRVDGRAVSEQELVPLEKILQYSGPAEESAGPSPVFLPEIEATAAGVRALRGEGELAFAVLTDTHYTVNGTWQDTVRNLAAVHEKTGLDAVIHLGDFTDGIVPRHITYHYIQGMLSDLRSLDIHLHVVLGNHDSNYFRNNPEVFPLEEQAGLYQSGSPGMRPWKGCTYCYCDYGEQKLRCIFLSAYRNEERLRYGYDMEQIGWLENVLREVPEDWHVLVFSHDAPIARLDFWSEEIRNEAALMDVLETWQEEHHALLGFVHGHTHADFVYRERSFPIISVSRTREHDRPEQTTLAGQPWHGFGVREEISSRS